MSTCYSSPRDEAARERIEEPVSEVCQEMWDCGLRVSPSTRTLADCSASIRTTSSSPCRCWTAASLAATPRCSSDLHDTKLPELVARESDVLLQTLSEMTEARHHRFGNTIFHLEPNLKDGPGGLRDCHVSQWMGMIIALASGGKQELLLARGAMRGMRFRPQSSSSLPARCYLHYLHNRDDNTINWTAQEGLRCGGSARASVPVSPAEWMRLYFGHAKAVYRSNLQLLSQISPGSLVSLFDRFSIGVRASRILSFRSSMAARISSRPRAREKLLQS